MLDSRTWIRRWDRESHKINPSRLRNNSRLISHVQQSPHGFSPVWPIIQRALIHVHAEALAYALQFARDLDPQLADKFVGMYVNERTLDYGPDGREAVRRLLDMGYQAGIITQPARVDFV